MTNSSDILFSKLAGFARALRNQGMQVGLGELIDAVRALELTGFVDRETVRLALRALLAKSRREMLLFDQCFDAYFVSEEEFQKNAQAEAQAEAAQHLMPLLTEEETDVLKRGRNAHFSRKIPQKASVGQYHLATGLEALFGWLYLKGEKGRLTELFESIVSTFDQP